MTLKIIDNAGETVFRAKNVEDLVAYLWGGNVKENLIVIAFRPPADLSLCQKVLKEIQAIEA